MQNEDSIRVACNCGSQIHSIQVDIFDDTPDTVMVSISYYPTTFWEKVKQFSRWVMGYDSLVADVVLRYEDMDELIDFYFNKKDSLTK